MVTNSGHGPLGDPELLRSFEDGTLDPAAFGHREHVRVAFAVLRRHPDLAEAATHFRAALRRFTRLVGAEGKYHETLTWAYLALVQEAMIQEEMDGASDASSQDFLARRPEFLDHRGGALARVYDVDAITRDDRARQVFVLPRASS